MRPAELRGVSVLAAWLLLAGCAATSPAPATAPLPSWQDSAARTRILGFVAAVTDASSPGWAAPADRIAVFDHDGTLIVEKPTLVQEEFLYARVRALAPEHPDWQQQDPFRAVLAGDQAWLEARGRRAMGPLMDAAQADLSQQAFDAEVEAFLAAARDPRFGRPYTQLVYQPMLELIDLLHANAFRVFIVTGGGTEFVREMAEPVYDVPRERVIGSTMKATLRDVDGRPEVWRQPGIRDLNVGRFKALNISSRIGRRPILAVGNSDGDLEMLRFAGDGPGTLAIVLHHDDAEREYVYDDDARRLRVVAAERGWLTVSIAGDFRQVYP